MVNRSFRELCVEVKILYPILWKVAQAIKQFEGWNPTNKSWRNKNPGNLRSSAFAETKDEDGYAVFATYEQGMYALCQDLLLKSGGKTSTKLTSTSTLLELMEVYAPADDNNDPRDYAIFIVDHLGLVGFDLDTQIWRLLEDA